MKRGEIWTASGNLDYAGKPRPVVIVQDDTFDATGSIVVCALTSQGDEVPVARIAIGPTPLNGLLRLSFIMVDKIIALPRARLGRRVGSLSNADVARLDQSLLIFLGLAR